ncbi:MAG: DUF805 domain-containing protein [Alphaproteobacteria bacterium]|nr:DUF805 domain-containing protein [Alphaproteobacteria bacterium]
MADANAYINDFKEAVIDALQVNYFQFKGRAARPAYWWFALFAFVIYFVLGMTGIDALEFLGGMALLLPSVGLLVRRLHDINRPGYWALVGLIPIVGWIVVIYWAIQPGTVGANDFGPAPVKATVSTAG